MEMITDSIEVLRDARARLQEDVDSLRKQKREYTKQRIIERVCNVLTKQIETLKDLQEAG